MMTKNPQEIQELVSISVSGSVFVATQRKKPMPVKIPKNTPKKGAEHVLSRLA